MATDVTVAPTDGAAVLFTNGGTGASPGYNAIDIRRLIRAAAAFQEGVFGSSHWKVTERGAGTNMSVDVAANLDVAVVKNDALLTPRDLYVVAPHSATINLGTIGGNSSGNPRLDYIVLQVRNQDHDGSGQYDARVRYLTGTANASASHTNPAGAPTIPDSAVLLAQVLVPNGTTTAITNSMIRDRRPWAQGFNYAHTRTATDLTTTSTSYGDLDATNWKVRGEFSGGPVVVEFAGTLKRGVNDAELTIGLSVDGGSELDRLVFLGSGISGEGRTLVWRPVLAAGSHLLAARWKVPGGTGTVDAASQPSWTVREFPASANNGTA